MSETMEAGPELNALVAEKFMFWTRRERGGGGKYDRESIFVKSCGDIVIGWHWRPSTNIADAWLVLERMGGPGFRVDLRMNGCGTFDCSLWLTATDDNNDECLAEITDANTAPLAICRAALQSVTPEIALAAVHTPEDAPNE